MKKREWKHNWVVVSALTDKISCSKCHNRKEIYKQPGDVGCPFPDPKEVGWESKSIQVGFLKFPVIREKDWIEKNKGIFK